jgi:hypothetical protein
MDAGVARRQPDRLLFFAVSPKGRVIGGRGFESRSTLAQVMRRAGVRRYEVQVRRGWAPPYRPEQHEARAETRLHEVGAPERQQEAQEALPTKEVRSPQLKQGR